LHVYLLSRSHYIPEPGSCQPYFLLAYKVIDLSRKILYTRPVAGVGAGLIAKNFFGWAHPLEGLRA